MGDEAEVQAEGAPAAEQMIEVEEEPGEAPAVEVGEAVEEEEEGKFEVPAAQSGGAPPWVQIPKDNGMGSPFRFPRAAQVMFVKLRAPLTRTPQRGDRNVILWELTDLDEQAAMKRAQGDPNRIPGELAKQMIRAFDGRVPDWTGTPGAANVDQFWREIGARYRATFVRICTQMHFLSAEDQKDFFANCIAVRSTG